MSGRPDTALMESEPAPGDSEAGSNSLHWWRRRELNPDPSANAEGLYMLICFSFPSGLLAGRVLPNIE